MNPHITFKVSGNDLSAYIDKISKQSDQLTNSAIKAALEQTNASKEQLSIVNQIISATERKNKLESQAFRSITLERREEAIRANREFYDGQKNLAFADPALTEDKRKEKIIALDGAEKANDQKIKADYRDQLNILKEQEKQTKLQTILSREQIQTAKEAAREQVKAITTGDKSLADVYKEVGKTPSDEEKLTLSLIEEQLQQEKRNRDKETKGNNAKEGVLTGILGYDNLNRVLGSASQMVNTKNGFDLIEPTFRTAGTIFGSFLNETLAKIIGEISGAAGQLIQREGIAKQDYLKGVYKYSATTGQDYGGSTNMIDVGVSATDFLKTQVDFARKRGYASSSDRTAREAIYAEKGLGVDQSTSQMLVELQRSSKESNRDLASLIGGILEKGSGSLFKNDHTFLNEFLSKFSTLQKELLKNSTTIATGTTMDILKQFDSMGGMYAARDPRSAGVVSSIHGALSSPGTDNMKALAYSVLREQNPNKGIFDLREEMQKGLASPAYLKGMIEMVDRMGGDEQMRLSNLSGMFKGVPLAAIRTLYENRNSLRNFDQSELRGIGINEGVMRGRAESYTTPMERNTADIETKLLSGFYKSFESMVGSFKEALSSSLSGAVININEGKGTIEFKGGNATKKPVSR